jgi:Reverse transcriptase (RNA-dependent DNA polymerase)
MIINVYMEQSAAVRIAGGYSEPSVIERGIRQGCCLSPLLFSIYVEMMMTEEMDHIEEEVKIGGTLYERCKGEHGMVAATEIGLQSLMDGLTTSATKYDMKINVKKTKTMKLSRKGDGSINILIEDQRVEQVATFKYLGNLITADGRCENEIKRNING